MTAALVAFRRPHSRRHTPAAPMGAVLVAPAVRRRLAAGDPAAAAAMVAFGFAHGAADAMAALSLLSCAEGRRADAG